MTIKLNYTKKDDIPESLKDEYTEKDGVFTLKAIDGLIASTAKDSEITGLKEEIANNKTSLSDTKKLLNEAEDKIKAGGEAMTEADKIEYQKALRERDEYKAKFEESDGKLTEANTKMTASKIRKAIIASADGLIDPKFLKDDILISSFASKFTIAQDGTAVIKAGDASTAGMSAKRYMEEFVTKNEHYKANSQGGQNLGNRSNGSKPSDGAKIGGAQAKSDIWMGISKGNK